MKRPYIINEYYAFKKDNHTPSGYFSFKIKFYITEDDFNNKRCIKNLYKLTPSQIRREKRIVEENNAILAGIILTDFYDANGVRVGLTE